MTKLIEYLPQIWKALVAGWGAAVFEYGLAQRDGMTDAEWVYVVLTALGVGLAVFAKRNAGTPTSEPPS